VGVSRPEPDPFDLSGTVHVVTGAATGIGEVVARTLVASGAAVALADVDPRVESVRAGLGDRASAHVVDVTEPGAADAVVGAALDRHGRLDGLVNSAGVVVDGTALTTPDDDWERAMAVNVTGTLRFVRAALTPMLEAGRGSVVDLGSVVGVRARQNGIAYVTAKAAVLGLTRSVALDFGRRGVRCNSVSPGAVDTPMLRAYDEREPGALRRLADTSYLGRVGTAADVAHLCRFLLGAGAGYLNGTDIVIDGGALAAFEPPRPTISRGGA
jgi:NAD(P)-dependent dehydrogenase (short-subunit alcohol dehydrogenase family)